MSSLPPGVNANGQRFKVGDSEQVRFFLGRLTSMDRPGYVWFEEREAGHSFQYKPSSASEDLRTVTGLFVITPDTVQVTSHPPAMLGPKLFAKRAGEEFERLDQDSSIFVSDERVTGEGGLEFHEQQNLNGGAHQQPNQDSSANSQTAELEEIRARLMEGNKNMTDLTNLVQSLLLLNTQSQQQQQATATRQQQQTRELTTGTTNRKVSDIKIAGANMESLYYEIRDWDRYDAARGRRTEEGRFLDLQAVCLGAAETVLNGSEAKRKERLSGGTKLSERDYTAVMRDFWLNIKKATNYTPLRVRKWLKDSMKELKMEQDTPEAAENFVQKYQTAALPCGVEEAVNWRLQDKLDVPGVEDERERIITEALVGKIQERVSDDVEDDTTTIEDLLALILKKAKSTKRLEKKEKRQKDLPEAGREPGSSSHALDSNVSSCQICYVNTHETQKCPYNVKGSNYNPQSVSKFLEKRPWGQDKGGSRGEKGAGKGAGKDCYFWKTFGECKFGEKCFKKESHTEEKKGADKKGEEKKN